MIKKSALLLLTLNTLFLRAQSADYLSHIKLLDRFLVCYESVSPWGDKVYALKNVASAQIWQIR
jgi:hypothetical protein